MIIIQEPSPGILDYFVGDVSLRTISRTSDLTVIQACNLAFASFTKRLDWVCLAAALCLALTPPCTHELTPGCLQVSQQGLLTKQQSLHFH